MTTLLPNRFEAFSLMVRSLVALVAAGALVARGFLELIFLTYISDSSEE